MLQMVAVSKSRFFTKNNKIWSLFLYCHPPNCFGILWKYLVQNYQIKPMLNFSAEWVWELQCNLFIAGMFYRRHLSTTNNFLRIVWNDGQTLTTKPLCSGHLSISGIIFKSELLLPPSTDLSIAGTSHNRPYKTFLVIHFHTIYFRQCFRLLHFFVFFFWASLIAFSGPQKLKLQGFQVRIHIHD